MHQQFSNHEVQSGGRFMSYSSKHNSDPKHSPSEVPLLSSFCNSLPSSAPFLSLLSVRELSRSARQKAFWGERWKAKERQTAGFPAEENGIPVRLLSGIQKEKIYSQHCLNKSFECLYWEKCLVLGNLSSKENEKLIKIGFKHCYCYRMEGGY